MMVLRGPELVPSVPRHVDFLGPGDSQLRESGGKEMDRNAFGNKYQRSQPTVAE